MAGLTGRPGRELLPAEVVEGLAAPVLTVCPHGDLAWASPGDVGKRCFRDGKPIKRATRADAERGGLSLDYFERFGLRPA